MGLLKRLVFPPTCAGCGEKFDIFSKDFDPDKVFCRKCRSEWERAKLSRCGKCGSLNIDCMCAPHLLRDMNVVSLVKFGEVYAVDSLIYRLKRRNINRLFDFTANEMSKHLITFVKERFIDLSNAVIVNVPRKRRSTIDYGFDHAKILAELVAKNIGIDYCEALVRVRGGRDQKKLGAAQRLENSKNKFDVASDESEHVRGKLVILVDDVVTSGATCAACIEIIKESDPMGIIILSIAKNDYSGEKNTNRDRNKKVNKEKE